MFEPVLGLNGPDIRTGAISDGVFDKVLHHPDQGIGLRPDQDPALLARHLEAVLDRIVDKAFEQANSGRARSSPRSTHRCAQRQPLPDEPEHHGQIIDQAVTKVRVLDLLEAKPHPRERRLKIMAYRPPGYASVRARLPARAAA